MKTAPLCFAGAMLLLLAQTAFSQANSSRTWVSGVGDDANPGSRTAPCKTFAGAVNNTVEGGEIDVLDPGGFGTVTITKSITIDGGHFIAGVLVSYTNGIIISSGQTTPITVTLRNLDMNGLGTGLAAIRVLSPVILRVENCTISGFTGSGIDFEPAAGSAPATGSALFVQDSRIRACTQDGIYMKPAAASMISIRGTTVEGCGAGFHGDVNSVSVLRGCSAHGNTGSGFETTVGATMTVLDSESIVNGTGITSAGTTLIAGNTVTNNLGEGLVVPKGGRLETFHTNPVGDNISKIEGLPNVSLRKR